MAERPAGALPPSVLQIGGGWFPECHGGLENVFYQLSNHLPQVGIAVRGLVVGSDAVASQSDGRTEAFAAASAPLPVRLWKAHKAIARHVALHPPDVVAAHFALFALPVLDKLASRPLVVHFHGPWAAESVAEGANWPSVQIKSAVERLVYRRADVFVVLSRAFGDLLARVYGVPPERVRVIPGGVDCARFDVPGSRHEARRRLGWQTARTTVLAVRRLVRRMGLAELIASIVEVRRCVPDLRLVIAGKGEEAQNLRRLIDRLDLTGSVDLIGFVPDHMLPWAYRAADLSVVPSTSLEGFGLITAESLAAGTPVMVTPVGGLPESVKALSPALVFSGHSPHALAQGLKDALTGRLPLPTSEQCRAYARRHFDWPVIAARTREVYLDALAPR
jgi:glycosyltransferase involved in cell wall biosynthesis